MAIVQMGQTGQTGQTGEWGEILGSEMLLSKDGEIFSSLASKLLISSLSSAKIFNSSTVPCSSPFFSKAACFWDKEDFDWFMMSITDGHRLFGT